MDGNEVTSLGPSLYPQGLRDHVGGPWSASLKCIIRTKASDAIHRFADTGVDKSKDPSSITPLRAHQSVGDRDTGWADLGDLPSRFQEHYGTITGHRAHSFTRKGGLSSPWPTTRGSLNKVPSAPRHYFLSSAFLSLLPRSCPENSSRSHALRVCVLMTS